MKRCVILFFALVLFSSLAFAAGPKNYQVTGPVLEVKDDVIVVKKGDDRWEIARDKDSKVSGDLKVGAKVTIQYQMKATAIEVKQEGKKEEPKEKKKK
jgi:hypothetical protein